MFSASVIKYVMLWKMCYLQLKTTTMNKIELWQITCFKKKNSLLQMNMFPMK